MQLENFQLVTSSSNCYLGSKVLLRLKVKIIYGQNNKETETPQTHLLQKYISQRASQRASVL